MQDPTEYLVIEIAAQPIPLCQLLKIANLVGGGGEAKIVISEGYVLLNNEVEYQKRKKIYENDVVEFNGAVIHVEVNANSKTGGASNSQLKIDTSTKQTSKKSSNKKKKNTDKNVSVHAEDKINPRPTGTRKPISF